MVLGSSSNKLFGVEQIELLDEQGVAYIQSADISGDLENVELNRIGNTFVDGDVNGYVILRDHTSDTAVLSATVIGDWNADLTLEDDGTDPVASIDLLEVTGRIGSPTVLANIAVNGIIGQMFAGEINADIRGHGNTKYVRQIFQIEATKENDGSGHIRGLITGYFAESLPFYEDGYFIRAHGDLEATVRIGGGFIDSPNNWTSEIAARNVGGLKGQVIVNAENGEGLWTSVVKVGPLGEENVIDGGNLSYSPPYAYPDSAASLGGGSIAVVPYHLHAADCMPYHGEVVSPASATNKICMRHYGPVTWDSNNGDPYRVERRKYGSSDPWIAQDCFTCEADEDDPTVVWVKTNTVAKFQRGYEYQVLNRTFSDGGDYEPVLRCAGLEDSEPPVSAATTLVFSVCNDAALGDADDNGCVNFADITEVLANYCSGSACCMTYGDADRDGDVDFADITQVLASFGPTGCGACTAGFATGSSGDGLATMGLERDVTAASSPIETVTNALASMGYASIEDFVAAIFAMDEASREAEIHRLGQLLGGE